MATRSGLDVMMRVGFSRLWARRIGVLSNPASIDSSYRHIVDLLMPGHLRHEYSIRAWFGPQHGIAGHTQDNMIEWEGTIDARTGIRCYSLYGAHRKPTPEMLDRLEVLVIDLQDVGARYYTFVWTMALCLEACAEAGIEVLVLDRPNPIGGVSVEGPILDPTLASFVGLYPIPTRHGMTIGEIALFVNRQVGASLSVVPMQDWDRDLYFDQTGLPWAMPSPNMPTLDTAMVYPGACLIEATNLSEGRGTTRPFEIFGAPFLHADALSDALNTKKLPGVHFRPLHFEPTFNKHAHQLCHGCFVHVTDRLTFEPVLTYMAVLQECIRQTGIAPSEAVNTLPPVDSFSTSAPEVGLSQFAWRRPPYEYEFHHRPIDLLTGNRDVSEAIESLMDLPLLRQTIAMAPKCFHDIHQEWTIYT